MLTAIVRFSLRFRGIVIALACLSLGYGLYSLSRAKYDVFPEFASPQVSIQTEAPGLSPEQVEVLVTQPIENALNGLTGVESLRSSSIQGLSVMILTFDSKSDIYRDRQSVAERLAVAATRLPQGVEAPAMTPLTSSTGDLFSIGLTSKSRSLLELRAIADWIVKPALLAVPGVASVGTFGGEVRQLQIQVDPGLLIKHNLGIEDVLNVARTATGIRGAGFIDTDNQRFNIQTEGQSLTASELAQTVLVHQDGANLTLGQIATVTEAAMPPISAASVMGAPGIVLNIWAQYQANTLEATKRVEKVLSELRPVLLKEGITLHPDLFRAANFIETAVANIRESLWVGAVLVTIVLFIFLLNFRTAAISCMAIPLSLLTAVAVMEYLGMSLNTMTLGGLAIAIGEVVDDAVIDVENIVRRLRESRQPRSLRSVFNVVLGASIEVRSAVVYATFAVLLVFTPIVTLSGLAGRLFSPLAIAYIFAVLASLLVALTVTPALCLVLLGRREWRDTEPRPVAWLKRRYRSLLLQVEGRSRIVIGGVALFIAAGLAVLPFLSASFLPELHEGHFIVHMTAVPGTSLKQSLGVGNRVTEALLKIPYVRSVAQRVGRAFADDILGTHASEFELDLKPLKGEEMESAASNIRHALSGFPGVNFAVNSFLTERIEETLTGYTAAVVINIFGKDLDVLDAKAREVAALLRGVQGVTDIQVQSPSGTPQIMVRFRKSDLSRWGFDSTTALDAVRTGFEGDIVGQIYDGNRVFNVVVILRPNLRDRVSQIGALPLKSPGGSYVLLRQIADIYQTSGRYVVLHEAAQRIQTVTFNVADRPINSVVDEARTKILSTVSLPPGSYIEYGGTAEAQAQSRRDLLVNSALAGIAIVLLLSIVLGNARNLVLVLLNLPFALVGGVLALFITGGELSVGSMVGFVTLFGITLRNSIMMISHFDHVVISENMPWGLETAIRGASERLAPILMTALVTAFGLLPLAIGSGDPGREIEGPMALVILGGLLTSTALNLLVLPTLAVRYGRFGELQPQN